MSRRKKKSRYTEEPFSFWQSYSDMMAALLLMFVLIISYTLLQSKISYEKKEAQLKADQDKIASQQQTLDEKTKQLVEQEDIMQQQQDQLDRIVGVKTNIIKALGEKFSETKLVVSMDPQTGAITFDSSVLFDFNSHTLKKSGKKFLDKFLPTYFGILLSDEFSDYVSEIIIEGHTDTQGEYMTNLQLSQERAFEVASYCLEEGKRLMPGFDEDTVRTILTANGRSWSNPIIDKDGTVNMTQSRRVEFKFRLKDEEMIQEMMDVLEDNVK